MTSRDDLGVTFLAGCLLFAYFLSAFGQEPSRDEAFSPRQLLDNLAAKKYSGRRIDLVFSNARLQDIVAELEKTGGLPLKMDPSIKDRATYRVRDIPWDEALAAVLADNNLHLLLNLEGTGFKIGRGKRVVLSLNDSRRAKIILFLYNHLYAFIAGIILLMAVIIAWRVFRNRLARSRPVPKKALLATAEAESAKAALLHLLEVEKIFRDETLTLPSLADKLKVSPHELSWLLNEEIRLSFPALISRYRVEDVKSRFSDLASNDISILQAALDAGFNTKASFNRAFKKSTGMTPSQFKKSLPR
jgi:AraC-like DNA-binding protein